ncbi:hypothetical protein CPB84DRAFT_1786256 [Gymnopilus junonius]|uniref:Secreted protein n=1 Tax=Gymnopilus junonius TaxID=109634 RepID=A0A9P5NIH0_GYMJU|nr:hypothetical protein CPB84DRAFT_1786256 [Gymnopilus junonius]
MSEPWFSIIRIVRPCVLLWLTIGRALPPRAVLKNWIKKTCVNNLRKATESAPPTKIPTSRQEQSTCKYHCFYANQHLHKRPAHCPRSQH